MVRYNQIEIEENEMDVWFNDIKPEDLELWKMASFSPMAEIKTSKGVLSIGCKSNGKYAITLEHFFKFESEDPVETIKKFKEIYDTIEKDKL